MLNTTIFPKKWAFVSVAVTFAAVFGSLYLLFQNIRQFESYQLYYFPIYERVSNIQKLSHNIQLNLSEMLIKKNDKLVKQVSHMQIALGKNTRQLNFLINMLHVESSAKLKSSIDGWIRAEQEILELVKNKNYRVALKKYESSDFKVKREAVEGSLDEVLEQLRVIQKKKLIRQKLVLDISLIGSFLAFLVIVFLWWRVLSAFFDNLTLKKKAEIELESERLKLIQAEKMAGVGEIAGRIAHEINNPLMIINGFTLHLRNQVEANRLDSKQAIILFNKILQTTARVGKTIKGLRNISRNGNNDEYEVISAKKLIADTLELYQSRLDEAGIQVQLDPIPEDHCVEVRAIQIEQVFLSLLSNSRDAIAEIKDKWIRISTCDLGDFIQFIFTDCGNGIDLTPIN